MQSNKRKSSISLTISEDEALKQEVLMMMPLVRDANAIATELKRNCKVEIVLVSALAKGKTEGRTEVRQSYRQKKFTCQW